MPRTPRRLAALLLAGATLASLAACTPEDPEPTSSSPPPVASRTDDPIFASDEEALAAAVAAYEQYTKISTQLSANPDLDVDSIRDVATESHASDTIRSLDQLHASGARAIGEVDLHGFTLVEVSNRGPVAAIQMYACNDLINYRIVNAAGEDITPTDRADAVTFLVSLEGDDTKLLVSGTEPWSGSSVC